MTHHEPTGLIGQPIKREDDRKLVSGRGRFVDDLNPPGTLHVAFVRSPYAHAEIVSVETAAAKNAPGVVAVVTGAGLGEWMKPTPIVEALLPNRPLIRHSLVADRARYAGDAVAAVIAETAAQAADA
ncbi:MAG TPA: xanthine dehydrogenase family protein molybdopterin-binding subunit, partial [Thermomicrobiales bacterium]|nr:xanthine dehydrogenase family protein molybdopterin-binding subunit [Thermomicrobiales bacterium]